MNASSMNNTETRTGQVRIYGVGGAGSNVTSQIENVDRNDVEAFIQADVLTCYADTSRSNLEDGIPNEKFYLIPARDGSGKIRTENKDEIAEYVLPILQKFQPADLNIVIHSGGGGSGSVIGPMLVRELMKRGVPVLVFMVGSAESVKDAQNSLATLKTYASLVSALQVPLTLAYLQNTRETPRETINTRIKGMVSALLMLFSRNNKELDTQDLINWLRFDKGAGHDPQLSVLSMFGKTESVPDIGNLLSLATLTIPGADTSFNGMLPAYHAIGFVQTNDNTVRDRLPVHFAISDGILSPAAEGMQRVLDQHQQSQNAMVKTKSILGKTDQADDGGMVW
jgi:hypothetical protein